MAESEQNSETQQVTAPPPMPPINPLLERARIPGETFRLPSRGLFYKNGELDPSVEDGEVHVHAMTAFDEIVIRSPDKLFSGEAVEEVFQRCIPDVKKPKELFAKDVDFLMVCLRKVTYGGELEIQHTHTCEGAKEHTYSISVDNFIRNAKVIDPTTINSIFQFELENGQQVTIHPAKFKDAVKMMQALDLEETDPEVIHKRSVESIVSIISDVDGINDPRMIAEWINAVPARWIHKLTEAVEKASDWGPDFETKAVCKDCGEEMDVNAPLNPVAFFI